MKTTCCNAHRSWWSITASLLLWAAVAMAHAGTVTYVYTDPQGTPLAEADAQGHITARFDYSPYGSIALGTAPNGPGYTGHVNDSETGLVYMQARYYDPAVGRFLSTDPVSPAVGNLSNFNRYAYANNNPIVNIDPDGKETGHAFHDEWVIMGGHVVPTSPNDKLSTPLMYGMGGLAAVTVGAEVVGAVKTAVMIKNALTDTPSASTLTEGQAKNLSRFEKKFSNANRNVDVSPGKDGAVTLKNEVPGKVPGSKAVYEKTVDSSGKTTSATKTTYDPKGEIVHVKDKLDK